MNFIRRYGLLLIVALPFFVALEDSAIWDTTEAFYAQTPREMVERGDWLIPYFNGKPRLNKPPLAYWVVAPFYQIFSPAIFWERWVIALLAYGSVLAVFANGRILYNQEVALLAAGIFATTFRFLILARRLLIDVLLLFCLLWAIAFFLSWLKSQQKSYFLLASLFFGLAFLAKGPVAFLPVCFLALYLLFSGRVGQLAHAPWLTGTLICLSLCSFWFLLLGARLGWEPIAEFFLAENLGRFTSLDFGPERSFFYYIGVFLGDFFPWSLLFLAAVTWTLAGKNKANTEGKNEHWMLLSLWIVTVFLFFSFSHNKQEYYILPLYPAAALWVAVYLNRTRPSLLLTGSVATLIAAVALGLFLVSQVLADDTGLWIPLLTIPPFAWGLMRRRYSLTIAALSLFYFTFFAVYSKPLEQYRPVSHFAQKIRESTSQGEQPRNFQAGYYRFAAPSLAFYLNRPIFELNDLETAIDLLESEFPVYLIVSAEHYSELEQATARPLEILEVRPKLDTTARTLMEGFRRGPTENLRKSWTRPIYLITN